MNRIHLATLPLLFTGLCAAQVTDQGAVKKGATSKPSAKPAIKQDKQGKPAETPKPANPIEQLRTSLNNARREAEYLRQVKNNGGLLARFKRNRAATREMLDGVPTLATNEKPVLTKFVARLMGDAEKGTMAKDVVFLVQRRAVTQTELDGMIEYLESYPRAEATENVKSQAIATLVRAYAGEVMFPKTARPAYEEIQELAARLAKGESFSELARAHSDDLETRDQGGKRGFIVRGEADKNYARSAFALSVGQVSKVVRSVDGYHLIRLLAKKKGNTADQDKIKTSHILKRFTPSAEQRKLLLQRLASGRVDVAFRKDELRKFCPASFK